MGLPAIELDGSIASDWRDRLTHMEYSFERLEEYEAGPSLDMSGSRRFKCVSWQITHANASVTVLEIQDRLSTQDDHPRKCSLVFMPIRDASSKGLFNQLEKALLELGTVWIR